MRQQPETSIKLVTIKDEANITAASQSKSRKYSSSPVGRAVRSIQAEERLSCSNLARSNRASLLSQHITSYTQKQYYFYTKNYCCVMSSSSSSFFFFFFCSA